MDSHYKGPVTRKARPCLDVIMSEQCFCYDLAWWTRVGALVLVNTTGHVTFVPPTTLQLPCNKVEEQYVCQIRIGSWTFSDNLVHISAPSDEVTGSEGVNLQHMALSPGVGSRWRRGKGGSYCLRMLPRTLTAPCSWNSQFNGESVAQRKSPKESFALVPKTWTFCSGIKLSLGDLDKPKLAGLGKLNVGQIRLLVLQWPLIGLSQRNSNDLMKRREETSSTSLPWIMISVSVSQFDYKILIQEVFFLTRH